MLSIEPDARKRALNITGEAKNADDMVAYIALLKAQEMFVGVVLVRHEINEQDPPARLCECCTKVDGSRRFSDATFLIGNRDDPWSADLCDVRHV